MPSLPDMNTPDVAELARGPNRGRDLAAAVQDTKGTFEQQQATYETTTAASLPEEIQKAEADVQQAQQALDAQEKVFQSRQQLFDQGIGSAEHRHEPRSER